MLENIIIFVKSFNLSPHQSFKWFLFLWSAAFIKSLFHTRLFLSSRILNFWGNHLSLTYHHTLYVLKFSHIFFWDQQIICSSQILSIISSWLYFYICFFIYFCYLFFDAHGIEILIRFRWNPLQGSGYVTLCDGVQIPSLFMSQEN